MDCGIITSKTVLLFLSLIFWAASGALGYVGYHVISNYDNFQSFIQDKQTLIPAAIIISISVVMFVCGLVGCCATLRESKVGLGFFFVIIFLIFAAEVAALVLSFIFKEKMNGKLEGPMTEAFEKYGGIETTKAVDSLQTQLMCCGVKDYTSWTQTPWFTSNNNTVPRSCCKNSTLCTGSMDQPDLLNVKGCEPALESLLHDVINYAMLVTLGFAIFKLFGMTSVCVITCRYGSRRRGYQPLYA